MKPSKQLRYILTRILTLSLILMVNSFSYGRTLTQNVTSQSNTNSNSQLDYFNLMGTTTEVMVYPPGQFLVGPVAGVGPVADPVKGCVTKGIDGLGTFASFSGLGMGIVEDQIGSYYYVLDGAVTPDCYVENTCHDSTTPLPAIRRIQKSNNAVVTLTKSGNFIRYITLTI